jgi:hypothetical protein
MADEPATEAAEAVNQGATGDAPPATAPEPGGAGGDAFAARPEAFVGAAFAGGFALALLMRRWVS